MYTIVLATQKGGSGKSTLAIGLSVAAQATGHSVRLIETDRLGTLSRWQSRRALAEPMVEAVFEAVTIPRRLQALERGGVSLAVIDTASGMHEETTAAIKNCDLLIIPARPSVADIEATAATLGIARGFGRPFVFVLNQTPWRAGARVSEARAELDRRGLSDLPEVVAQPFIALRNDHQDALAAGLAVCEYAPGGKAAGEIGDLWRWIDGKLIARPSISRKHIGSPAPAVLAEAAPPLAPLSEIGSSWDACL